MNFMRRLVSQPKSSTIEGPQQPEEQALAIAHLTKLFNEYKKLSNKSEPDSSLYAMLPLFCKIFSQISSGEIVDKFVDVHTFCTHVSRLMVKEIKTKAVHQSTEEASRSIVEFLEPVANHSSSSDHAGTTTDDCEEECPGWLLLTTLRLLSLGPVSLVECMIAANLPSTLVKCLYILFDLPAPSTTSAHQHKGVLLTQVQHNTNKRLLLHTLFKQLVQRLCAYPAAAEELAKKEDLGLLFKAMASWCPVYNRIWRKTTADLLVTLAQDSLNQSIIQQIHNQKCIAQCLGSMKKGSLGAPDIVDVFVALFHFLRESSETSQVLLDDFRTCQGYMVMSDFMLKLEKEDSEESRDALSSLVVLMGKLALCGFIELKPKPGIADQLFTIKGFQLPKPKGRNESVRNIQAFHVLQSVFLKAQTSHLCWKILEVMKDIYNQDPANYFILDSQNTIAVFAEKIYTKSPQVQESFFDILYTIVVNLKYVPMKEISSLTILIKTCNSTVCLRLCLRTLLRLTLLYSVFKDVYRDLGVLELAVNQLHLYAHAIKDTVPNDNVTSDDPSTPPPSPSMTEVPEDQAELGRLVLDLLAAVLSGSGVNASVFRQCGGARCLVQLIGFPISRESALIVMQHLILTGAEEEDMSSILRLVYTSSEKDIAMKTMILRSLCTILRDSHRCRSVFRRASGFFYLVQEFQRLEGSLAGPEFRREVWTDVPQEEVLALLKTLFATITVAMKSEPGNARHFSTEIRYDKLTKAVRLLGCFGPLASTAPPSSSAPATSPTSSNVPFNHRPPLLDRETSWQLGQRSCRRSGVARFLTYFLALNKAHSQVLLQITPEQKAACLMARCLYDMALDAFDKPLTRRRGNHGSTRTQQLIHSGASYSLQSVSLERPLSLADSSSSLHSAPKPSSTLPHSHSQEDRLVDVAQPSVASSAAGLGPVSLPVSPPSAPSEGSPVSGDSGSSWSYNGWSDPRGMSVVHAEAALGLLRLAAVVNWQNCPEENLDFQIAILDVLKSVLKSERNQQIMCDAGMPHDLLTYFRDAMTDEDCQLHAYVQRLFEKLAAQSLTPKDLREFLRLANPLCCEPLVLNEASSPTEGRRGDVLNTGQHGGPLTLSRVKCLVSMTTPRDARLVLISGASGEGSSETGGGGFNTSFAPGHFQSASRMPPLMPPPFIEFDMSHEWFSCLFLPSIAPQSVTGTSVVNVGLVPSMDSHPIGGIGADSDDDNQAYYSGERIFPPPNGFTYSSWVCVDTFCPAKKPHPVRLLTLTRTLANSLEQIVCLSVYIRPGDKALVVSTHEKLLQPPGLETSIEDEKASSDGHVTFQCPDLGSEGRWRHIVLVFQRAGMLKTSTCSLYVDGNLITTHKLSYISSHVTFQGLVGPVVSVSAYVNTPPALNRVSSTLWRQGPLHIVEDALPGPAVVTIFQLGPNYMGSLQAPSTASEETLPPLFQEEKLMLGIYGTTQTTITIAKIRKIYNQSDAKSIARLLHLSARENTTPIRLLPNTAAHLQGPARTLGGVLIGYQGIRAFTPRPVARVLEYVGGTAVLLGLVAMAGDPEGLYAAVKALCCAVKNNPAALRQMDRERGYQVLAMLLKRKRSLLNNQILYLVFSLVGSLDSLRDRRGISHNWSAFEDLLGDIEVWRETDGNLLRSLLEHFYELIIKSDSLQANPGYTSPVASNQLSLTTPLSLGGGPICCSDSRAILLDQGLVVKLLHLLMTSSLQPSSLDTLKALFQVLLANTPRIDDLRRFGQFMVWTLPPKSVFEENLEISKNADGLQKQMSLDSDPGSGSCFEGNHANLRRMLRVRNFCLEILIHMMTNPQTPNLKACEDIERVLGFDWLMLFLQGHVHSSTVVLSLHALVLLLGSPRSLGAFRDGILCSGWLEGTHMVLQRRHGINLTSTNFSVPLKNLSRTNRAACQLPGFVVLQNLIADHCRVPEVYFLLTALLLAHNVKQVPINLEEHLSADWLKKVEFELDSLYNFIFRDNSSMDKSGSSSNSKKSSHNQSARNSELCPEAACILLTIVRSIISETAGMTSEEMLPWHRTYPVHLLQFFVYLYQSNADFHSLAMAPDFLIALASVLFPKRKSKTPGGSAPLSTSSTQKDLLSPATDQAQPLEDKSTGTEKTKTLTSHSVKKFVLDFFKMIVTDNFAFPTNKSVHIVDILLESRIEHSTPVQQAEFQTLLLLSLMDHFLAAEILSGQNLPLPAGGSHAALPNNTFYFATRVVDKVIQGAFHGRVKDVIFLTNRLLVQGKKRQLPCDPLYRCLNRLLLHQLSRPLRTIADQAELVGLLQKLIAPGAQSVYIIHLHRAVLSPSNSDPCILACLVHLLIQMVVGRFGPSSSQSQSPTISADDVVRLDKGLGGEVATEEGFMSIARAASKVWEVLFENRRQVLEDLAKQSLVTNTLEFPHLTSVVHLLVEPCQKAWNAYQDFEQSGGSIGTQAGFTWGRVPGLGGVVGSGGGSGGGMGSSIQANLAAKLSRVSNNVMRLAGGQGPPPTSSATAAGSMVRAKRESAGNGTKNMAVMTYQEAQEWTEPHTNIVKELVEFHQKQYSTNEQFMRRYLESKWQTIEQDLTRERGLWGPPMGCPRLDKWTLDSTEGPCRMRKRMLKNDRFYEDYPFRDDTNNESERDERYSRYRAAICKDSRLFYFTYRPSTLLTDDSEPPHTTCPPQCLEHIDELNATVEAEADLTIQTSPPANEEISLQKTHHLLQGACTVHPDSSKSAVDSPTTPTDLDDLVLQALESGDREDEPEKLTHSSPHEAEQPLKPSSNGKQGDDTVDNGTVQSPSTVSSAPNPVPTATAEPDPSTETQDSQASILHLLEPGERMTDMYRCARIIGLDVCEGILLFGRDHLYVVDGFTLVKTKEIVDIESLPPEVHDPIVPRTASTSSNAPGCGRVKRQYFKVAFEDIREVHRRRYLLQPLAIEVFNADGRNFLLVFRKGMQEKLYMRFRDVSHSLTDNSQDSVSGQKQNTKIESVGPGILNSFKAEKSVTQRWERGEISNFQYLMHLNTLAKRSYNDLMQYPVFPWVVADFDSPQLNLSSPATFRDLSKPMGAQTPDRLSQFVRRYQEWDDPSGETPPYHYGTHYSSAMIVASFLIRMEPFAQHFLKLQGGHFDLADRMFHSIRDAWFSAAKHNMADVKELIPEFFYLPDFLVNSNNFDLGVKQNGVELGDVLLPPWAKGDPREFIRAHREALESDYVSAHLHEWIDLIFGYKQRGEASVDSVNVFHHLFYEGNVDIYSIEDPLRQSAVIGYINNFGQIPSQLFRRPHPSKRLSLPRSIDAPETPTPGGQTSTGSISASYKLFYHYLDSLKPSMQPIKDLKSWVGQILPLDPNNKTILAVEQNMCLIPPTYQRCLSWGFADGSIRVCPYESDKAIKICEHADVEQIMCAVAPSDRLVITAGVSTVVRVWQLNHSGGMTSGSGGLSSSGGVGLSTSSTFHHHRVTSGFQLKASLYGHTEAVTCLAVSTPWNLLVSGSRDRSCILWDLSRLCFLRQLSGHVAPVACVTINDWTGDLASCAGTWLYLWSVNGESIAKVNTATTGRNKQILAVTMSYMMDWDSNNVIMIGGTDGVVQMWSLEYIQAPLDTSRQDPGLNVDKEEMKSDTLKPSDNKFTVLPKSTEVESMEGDLDADIEEDEDGDEDEESDDNAQPTEAEDIGDGPSDALVPSSSSSLVDIGQDALKTTPQLPGETKGAPGDEADFVIISDMEVRAAGEAVMAVAEIVNGPQSSAQSPVNLRRGSLPATSNKPSENRFSYSTSAVINAEALASVNNQTYKSANTLREGFHWQRQLIFRSKLTMHTAYERLDNHQPAAVTALAISRDHRVVYVGDARGRVFSWCVPGEVGGRGGMADHWVRDEGAETCAGCATRFSITERRHHCRNCGLVFCSKCSRFEIEIYRLRLFKPVRVCQLCYNSLRDDQISIMSSTSVHITQSTK